MPVNNTVTSSHVLLFRGVKVTVKDIRRSGELVRRGRVLSVFKHLFCPFVTLRNTLMDGDDEGERCKTRTEERERLRFKRNTSLLLCIWRSMSPANNVLCHGGSSRCQTGPAAPSPSSPAPATTTAQPHLHLMHSACAALFLY